jgi:DNA-binding PadR family transcriptional regulator
MERDGLVKSKWKITDSKRLRKYYYITEKGLKEQEQEKKQWFFVSKIFSQLLDNKLAS